jgi:hypothetical protein
MSQPRDPIRAAARRATAARRVGLGAKCACGEDRPEFLIPRRAPVTCYRCERRRLGKSTNDHHHIAGRNNDSTTIPVDANGHRDLSLNQYDWPTGTLRNQRGSPLLAGAARNRGVVDTNNYLADTMLIPNAEMLELLDDYLRERLGPNWWHNTPLEEFTPRRKKK